MDTLFVGCSSLNHIELPKEIENIGYCAFSDCENLTSIIIPKGIKSISDFAFLNCKNLKSVTIHGSLNEISKNLFDGCINLESIKLDNIEEKINWDSSIETINQDDMVVNISYGISKNNVIFKTIDAFKENGIIDKNLTQEQQEIQYNKIINNIFDNDIFKQSRNYNTVYSVKYLSKMIYILGIDKTIELLKIPEQIKEKDVQEYGEKLLEVYDRKFKLQGDLPILFSIFDNIDTYMSKYSNSAKSDRNKFYTKMNSILDQDKDINLETLFGECLQEIGVDFNDKIINKIKKELQTARLTDKESEIKNKIIEKLQNQETRIIQPGVTSSLIYNVIRKNILNDGKLENVEELFNQEINKKRENGQLFYGANILQQKDKILEIINELYIENDQLLNRNLGDVLKDNKNKIGNMWIKRLKDSKKNIEIDNMSEEEKNEFLENLQKNEINIDIDFDTEYKLKHGISNEDATKILDKIGLPELLTYEKAEMMFSRMKEPYSIKFGKWFLEHKIEIMENPEYCNNLAELHNEFKYLLQDSNTNANFENGKLTVKGAFDILNRIEKEVRPGNEELGVIAENLTIGKEELKKAEEIFEITKKREASYIPQVKAKSKRYIGRILRADDPMNIFAGNATNCCQRVGDVGEGSMEHAATENNGRIFIVEEIDENGKIIKPVAQSWVWRNKDRICFDNIEIPDVEKEELSDKDGDISAQQEILYIYKECAEDLIKKDKKMLSKLLLQGKITDKQYEELVLKDVTVGVGYNDLGILENSDLEVVPEEYLILPREKDKEYSERKPWVDSGRDSVVGEGAQLYLAKSDIERKNIPEETITDLDDLPLLYKNEREVRTLKSRTIDKNAVKILKDIEGLVYRDSQKVLAKCQNYEDIAKIYEMDSNNVQVYLSRDDDWYMIFEEKDDELYIADLAMINGINAQGKNKVKTEFMMQTLEIEQSVYSLMLQATREQKRIRFEATEDTSYKNIMNMVKKGLIKVEKDSKKPWKELDSDNIYDEYFHEDEEEGEYNVNVDEQNKDSSKIMMHEMTIEVDAKKMQERLDFVNERIEKKRESRAYFGDR